jgi:hypothetical protein
MAKMVTKNCQWCKQSHTVRAADLARGWGKFCSKSCKASAQEKRTGQYAKYQDSKHNPRSIPSNARIDHLRSMLDNKRLFMVMVDDAGGEYIDPEDDGYPDNDF